MDPFSIAMGLANFAPQIIKWVTGSDKASSAVEAVVDVAKKVTGQSTGDAALEALKADPALVIQFRTEVLKNETEIDKLYLADINAARIRDSKFIEAGTRNYRADILVALAVISVIIMTAMVWRSPDLNEYIKGTITLVLGRFLGYIDQIYNFEFGTTRTSKTKDATIHSLTR